MDGPSTAAETTPATVTRLEFDVSWSPGFVSAYLLDGDEPTLVDAGMYSADNETELGLEPTDVDHVVVTHPHIDHVGFVEHLVEIGEPRVYAPDAYRRTLSTPLSTVERRIERTIAEAGVPEKMADAATAFTLERVREVREALPADSVDVWIRDGESIDVAGRQFDATITGGHQREHLCFGVDLDGERALFSGDMAIRTFRAVAVHAGLEPPQREALAAYDEALDRLEAIDADRVYPGHGPVHTELREAIRTARESLDRLLERTEAALRPSGTHAVHAAGARTDDVSSGPWLPEAIAALAALERAGRAESYLEDGVRYYAPVE